MRYPFLSLLPVVGLQFAFLTFLFYLHSEQVSITPSSQMKISRIFLSGWWSLLLSSYYNNNVLVSAVTNGNDDKVHTDASTLSLTKASVYPLSCTDYKGMALIKYELYPQSSGSQCSSKPIGTYVTSLHRFMHAYWNYQALTLGDQFALPSDAPYLSYCLGLNEMVDGKKIYAKIACATQEKFASVKLRLYMYHDNVCTVPYDDGQSISQRIANGYQINGNSYSTEVSFRPPFYYCESCTPTISDSFNKNYWYDDDSVNAANQNQDVADDKYLVDDYVEKYAKHESRTLLQVVPEEEGALELFEQEFYDQHNRNLNNNKYQEWNLCKQLLLHAQWCDAKCRGTSFGSVSNWTSKSVSVIFTLSIIMVVLMVLIFSKRVLAYELAESLQDPDAPKFRGFPPFYVGLLYVLIICGILSIALLNMVHETIIMTTAVTIILFVYLMKLTLFDSALKANLRKEKFLDAARGQYEGPHIT